MTTPTAARIHAAALVAAAWIASVVPCPAQAADAETIKASAVLCEACHGPQGNPADPMIPALAGQPKQFITTQLVMYREGQRRNDVMNTIANGMKNAEINDYGTFFSAQKRVVSGTALAADKSAAGSKLAVQFNCTQCHGPALLGLQHIPRVAGQQPEYMRAQLRGFKAGTRFDMDGNMTAAAQALSPADIDLLTDYLASLK